VKLTKPQQSKKGHTHRPDEANVDHVDAKANGRSGTVDIGKGLCRACNLEKSDGPPRW
jgi:hypothetical protein